MTRASKRKKPVDHTQHHAGRLSLTPLYKTRLCNFYPSGKCRDGPLCNYAHGEEELRLSPDFERTSVCPILIKEGTCKRPECRYAHTSTDLRTSPVMLKTKMCRFFLNGNCVVGEACRFAHSSDELKEAAHVQQERLPVWAERRRRFCELGDQRLAAQHCKDALPPPTFLSQTPEPMFVQPSFWKAPGLPEASVQQLAVVEVQPGEAGVLPSQPSAKFALPCVPPPGLVRMVDQCSASHDLDDTREAYKATNAELVVDNVPDTSTVLTTSIGKAGKIVIAHSSLDADAKADAEIIAEDIALRRAYATWIFAGIGAVVVLQKRMAAAAHAKPVAIDIEDLTQLGKLCETCDLRGETRSSSRVRHKNASRGNEAAESQRRLRQWSCHRGRQGTSGRLPKVTLPCGQERCRFASCAICGDDAGSKACAACNCGLRIVQKNTFLTLDDEEERENGAWRRSKSL